MTSRVCMILARTTCAAIGYEKYVGLQHTLARTSGFFICYQEYWPLETGRNSPYSKHKCTVILRQERHTAWCLCTAV